MYSGFITPKRVVKRVGIHQRFDMAAYKMIELYLPTAEGAFPGIKEILHFEGYNGPDGLNTKVGLKPKGLKPKDNHDHNPSHLYDPLTDSGEVPVHIHNHYTALVQALKAEDRIRAAFEAAWLAHYIGDGLTPAHHWPLEDKVAEAAENASLALKRGDVSKFRAALQKNWAIWGAKGHMTTHFNFEMGIAFAMLVFRIKPVFSEHELARARQLGPVDFFKNEALSIANLHLYDRFYREGWTNDLARIIRNDLAPRTARTIGIIWLLALLEAGQELAVEALHEA
jgi:hypothetical protein